MSVPEHSFNYTVLQGDHIIDLERKVNEMLEKGYVLAGGFFMITDHNTTRGTPYGCQAVYFPKDARVAK